MPTAFDRAEFTPPRPPGMLRAFGLAIVAHVLLVVALGWGLRWNRDVSTAAAEAELWSATPQEAAPREVPVAPAPPPPPPPVLRAPPVPEPPVQRQADIAEEREKQKRAEQKLAEAEKRAEAQKRQAELAREKRRKEEAERKRELEEERQADARAAAADKRKKDEERKKDDERKRQQKEAREKLQAKDREDNLRRMQAMAGGTGGPSSGGSAAQSSGPSAGWAGRVRGRVKPNIVFTDDISGNPEARIEVRLAPDGTIVGKRVVKASGVKAWDDAVLRALERTETLPRDTDGRVPPVVELVFRPKD